MHAAREAVARILDGDEPLIALEAADGSPYGLFFHLIEVSAPGFVHQQAMGGFEHPDGRVEPIVRITPEVGFDPVNRRLRSGRVHFGMADGSTRTIEVEVLGDTGFHLGAGLYFGFKGHHHGEWRGRLHVEGEHLPDCTDPAVARAAVTARATRSASVPRSVMMT